MSMSCGLNMLIVDSDLSKAWIFVGLEYQFNKKWFSW